MRLIVLSGISHHVLKQLEIDKVKTIEIRSPHNFLSALETDAGDLVFLTPASKEDVRPGTTGIFAKIREKQVSMHRVVARNMEFYEEAEFQLARLQLEIRGHARVRRVECCALGEATVVDADEVLFFEGR